MTDPSRLLATARGGLERELLRSALTDVAPDEVRARVLRSVNEVLAASGALVAGASYAGSSTATAGTATSTATAGTATAGAGMAGAGAAASAGGKLFLGLPWLHAVCLSGLVVAGAGAGVALYRPVDRGSQPQQGAQLQESKPRAGTLPERKAAVPAASEEPAPRALEPNSPPEARSDRATPGTLVNTRAHANRPEPRSDRNRAARADADRVEAASRAGTDAEELSPDWLGEQLLLLREARGHMESANWERAAELLDGYARRFPGGVVGPQVLQLNAELRQRVHRSAAP